MCPPTLYYVSVPLFFISAASLDSRVVRVCIHYTWIIPFVTSVTYPPCSHRESLKMQHNRNHSIRKRKEKKRGNLIRTLTLQLYYHKTTAAALVDILFVLHHTLYSNSKRILTNYLCYFYEERRDLVEFVVRSSFRARAQTIKQTKKNPQKTSNQNHHLLCIHVLYWKTKPVIGAIYNKWSVSFYILQKMLDCSVYIIYFHVKWCRVWCARERILRPPPPPWIRDNLVLPSWRSHAAPSSHFDWGLSLLGS